MACMCVRTCTGQNDTAYVCPYICAWCVYENLHTYVRTCVCMRTYVCVHVCISYYFNTMYILYVRICIYSTYIYKTYFIIAV